MIRGLTRDDVPVTVKTKIVEVDPRGVSAEVWGIGNDLGRIAEGVINPRSPGGKWMESVLCNRNIE